MTIAARYRGVNLSGGEFGANVPGTLNTDYTYPTTAEVDYYVGKGFNCFRVPFLYQRLTRDIATVNSLIDYIATKNATVVMDWHNYGVDQTNALITPTNLSNAVSAWAWMTNQWKGKTHVILGLMNEPNKQTPADWFSCANSMVATIRAAGSTQLILVPGTAWTGAWTWITSGNAAAAVAIQDPQKYFAYEVHQYLDTDGSGNVANPVVTGAGSTRLAAATTWARSQGAYLWLGEFGSTSSAAYLTELDAMLSFMGTNNDVWLGWTYWAGGPWWGSYPFSCEPSNGNDSAQTKVLVQHLGASTPAPVPVPSTTVSPEAVALAAALQQLGTCASAYILKKG